MVVNQVETEFCCHIDYRTLLDNFKRIIKNSGLKFTKQREAILKELYIADSHLTSEELYEKLKKSDPTTKIGIATVYRTLSLLEKEEFVTFILSEKDAKRYELASKEHHDHIICRICGKIVEFVSQEIEDIQENIAKSLGFKVLDHSMQIHGICLQCQNSLK